MFRTQQSRANHVCNDSYARDHDNFEYTRKNAQVVASLQTSCNKSVHKLSTSCVRIACF